MFCDLFDGKIKFLKNLRESCAKIQTFKKSKELIVFKEMLEGHSRLNHVHILN